MQPRLYFQLTLRPHWCSANFVGSSSLRGPDTPDFASVQAATMVGQSGCIVAGACNPTTVFDYTQLVAQIAHHTTQNATWSAGAMPGKRFKSIMCELMAFKAGHAFPAHSRFSQETLLEVAPEDVCHWMNSRAFGEPEPSDDAKPVNARASTLEYAKKAISSFIPRRTLQWDPIRKEGNPTRSEYVNAVIKRVKRSEVRGEGVQSAARRPIEYEEFINVLEQVRSRSDRGNLKFSVSAALAMQWHLIARIDDMMKLKFDSLTCNLHHPGTLICQLRWSKNISEEREAP